MNAPVKPVASAAVAMKPVRKLGPAGHNALCSNKDFDFFYRGLEARKLLVQRCSACGALRSLPTPACAQCHSLKWEEFALNGGGRIHSFVVHHHPPLPGFATPHPIALVDMDEGVRMLGAMDGTDPEKLAIDLPVKAHFLRRGAVAGLKFRLVGKRVARGKPASGDRSGA